MTDITPERLAQIEADAPAIIHNAMRFDRMEFTPPWINGNSDAEDEARQTVRILRIPDLIAALEAAQAENANLRAGLNASKSAFKNFHRMLCDRFEYTHDAVDWQRDQVSLMEWIADRIPKSGAKP